MVERFVFGFMRMLEIGEFMIDFDGFVKGLEYISCKCFD